MLYKVIGLMSGTSLDGLDIAYCHYQIQNNKWSYTIIKAETLPYSESWVEKLVSVESSSSYELARADKEFGEFLAASVIDFIARHSLEVDIICSHGQTIFHRPEINLTTQIGDINVLAAKTGILTIGDFRRLDLALGGQGAPLVPIGDRHLFGDYAQCLNLGGFSNISFERDNERIAYDVCPVNIVLNALARREGMPYDKDGEMARSGEINKDLLSRLNDLDFYKIKEKKSLGKEWVLENVMPLLDEQGLETSSLLATFSEHVADQLAKNISGEVLVTGGGAYNKFLISRLRAKTSSKIHIPEKTIINYKEAMIFGFLGVLRLRNEVNALASVTGASRDSCTGLVALGQ